MAGEAHDALGRQVEGRSMTWPEFFAQWGLVGLGFVWGYWVARRKPLHEARRREQEDAIMIVQLTKALDRSTSRDAAARRQTNERFDWKAGTGVA